MMVGKLKEIEGESKILHPLLLSGLAVRFGEGHAKVVSIVG